MTVVGFAGKIPAASGAREVITDLRALKAAIIDLRGWLAMAQL